MNITKKQLRRIIKEELKKSLAEIASMPSGEEWGSSLGAAPPPDAGAAFDEYSPENEELRAIDFILSDFGPQFKMMGIDPAEVEKALHVVDAAAVFESAVDKVDQTHTGVNLRDQRFARDKIAEEIVAILGLSGKSIPKRRF